MDSESFNRRLTKVLGGAGISVESCCARRMVFLRGIRAI